ncbi:MAG: (2Fe-2S)-binding protein [Lysobacteraceae bacterium]
MYVCLCNGITDRTVRDAASAGARSLSDLTAMTGCASVCGSCGDLAQQLLDETLREHALPLPLLAA